MADWSVLKKSNTDFLYPDVGDSSFDVLGNFSNLQCLVMSPVVSLSCRYEEDSCCSDNVDSFIAYLNQELIVLGFRPISLDEDKKLVSALNHLYEFFQIFQRSSRMKEELENRLHRKTSELDIFVSTNSRLKQEKGALERRIASEQEKHRQVLAKNKTLTSKWKSEKDELTHLKSIVKDRDHQYKHELKKKERECNKLKERLHQLLSDKSTERKFGLEMDSPLLRTDGKRGTWKTTNNKQEEMYKLLISNYESKQEELMVENKELRECIMNMQKELSTVLNRQQASTEQNEVTESLSPSSSEDEAIFSLGNSVCHSPPFTVSEGYFQLPYDIMRDDLQKSFKETCKKIKKNLGRTTKHSRQSTGQSSSTDRRMSKISPINKKQKSLKVDSDIIKIQKSPKVDTDIGKKQRSPKVDTDEDLDKIQKQLYDYKDIIQQQEELLKQLITSQSKSMENSFLHESHLYEERESLSEQRRLLQDERDSFQKERKDYTEARIKLNKERRAKEFERAAELKKQFLQLTPFEDGKLKVSRKEGTRLLPSTPMFSPAPSEKPKTPSTVELYRMLGITPKSVQRQFSSSSGDVSFMEKKSSHSSESLFSGSCKSAPSAVGQISSPPSQMHANNMNILKTRLFRRSSTGSNESLEL